MSTASRWILPLVLVLSAGSACVPDPGQQNPGDGCSSLPSRGPNAAEPRVAVLVDVSNSTRAAARQVALPDYVAQLEPAIHAAVDDRARVAIGSFSGSSVRWLVRDQATDAKLNNPKNQERQQSSTKKCLISLATETLSDVAGQPGTDVLGALRTAAEWVGAGTGPKSIIVATDGLATTGCADLTRARFDGDAEVSGIVKVCLDRKEMRADLLREVKVSMIGIGRPGPAQPIASPEQLGWLASLWQALCEAGGGSCSVATADPGRTAASADPSGSAADPAVGFSSVWHFTVPNGALFDIDSAELRTDAAAHLIGIAVALRTVPGSKVEVAGHADATGNSAHNQDLSERRAARVGRFLGDNGVTNISVRGYGDTRPRCTQIPANDACLQENRRVEITATR